MEVYERFGIKKEEWETQKAQFDYYVSHQAEYVALFNGKHLVFHQMQVKGAFDTMDEACDFARANFARGSYIIQKCSPGDRDYTVRLPYRLKI